MASLFLKATSGVLTFVLATIGVVTLIFVVRESALLIAQASGRRLAL